MMEAQNNEQEQQLETVAVLWSGHLLYDDQVVPCLIVSISAAGAVVETENAAVWNSSVILRHPRIGDLQAVVVSRKNNELNLQFPQKEKEDQEKDSTLIENALR
jgi:predicted RNA-binding protein (virulence factor B family)